MKVKVRVFLFWHFLQSKISFESSFLIKCYIRTVLKKNWAFWSVFEKVKKWISQCILKMSETKNYFFFIIKRIHKQVKIIRRRLFLRLSEAQSIDLWWRRLPKTAARWRCVILFKYFCLHQPLLVMCSRGEQQSTTGKVVTAIIL